MPDAPVGKGPAPLAAAAKPATSWIPSRLRGLFGPSWRVSAASRLEALEQELGRAHKSADFPRVHEAIQERIEDAWQLLGPTDWAMVPVGQGGRQDRTAIRRINLSRDRSSGVAKSIHRGEELLLLISDDDDFRARAQRIGDQLTGQPLDAHDRNVHRWLDFFRFLATRPKSYKYTSLDRDNLRSILDFLNQGSEAADDGVRGFRNTLGAMAVLLLLMLFVVGIVAAIAPALFSLCTPASASQAALCPNGSGSPGRGDVAGIELAGALGGLLSALVVYAQLEGKPNPHLIQLVQALIKVPVGAAVSLTVIELMQQGALTSLGLLAPQPGARVLGLAVLFGFAQQAATQALDQYARRLLRVTSAAKGETPAISG